MSDIFLGEPRYTRIQSARQATSARPQHFDGFPKVLGRSVGSLFKRSDAERPGQSAAPVVGPKKMKKRLHKCQTTHYKSAHEYGTPLYFIHRAPCTRLGKLAAEPGDRCRAR